MNQMEKEYIGDGVYVSHDGYRIWLETDRERPRFCFGTRAPREDKNEIALEMHVLDALNKYAERLFQHD